MKERSRRLRNEAEEEIVQQLAPHLIPAMDEVPDRRLARNADQPWANSIPVPLYIDKLLVKKIHISCFPIVFSSVALPSFPSFT